MNRSSRFVVLVAFVLVFNSLSALADSPKQVDPKDLKNRKCTKYIQTPFIMQVGLSCGGGQEENRKNSACVGVGYCTGTLVKDDGSEGEYEFTSALVCPPLFRKSENNLNEAYCPSAHACSADKTIQAFTSKGTLAEPQNLPLHASRNRSENPH